MLALRAQLDDATLGATTTAPPWVARRAVVMLDATNEHALKYAAFRENVNLGARPSFFDVLDKVSLHLGARWQFTSQGDVRRLHTVRNTVQHVGATPSATQLATWAAATRELARTLMLAVFGVDLDKIALSRVVEHPGLRALFEAAERALDDGDPTVAVHASFEAFSLARDRWSHARDRDWPTGQFRNPTSMLADVERDVDDARSEARYTSDVIAFGDVGEYEWLVKVDRDATDHHGDRPPTEPTADDARRAFTFAFWWALRSEAAVAALDVGRAERALVARRSVRTDPASRTRIADVKVSGGEVILTLADVPPPDEFDAWRNNLQRRLYSCKPPAPQPDQQWGCRIQPVGVIVATLSEPDPRERHNNGRRAVSALDAATVASEVVAVLRDALAHADEAIEERREEAAKRRSETSARREEYRAAVLVLGFDWVADVHTFGAHANKIEDDELGGVRIDLTPAAFAGVARPADVAQAALAAALHDKHKIDRFARSHDYLTVAAKPDPAELVSALRVVDDVMRVEVMNARAAAAEAERVGAVTEAAFRAALGDT